MSSSTSVSTRERRKRLAIKIALWGGLGVLVATALVTATIATVFWYYGRDKNLPSINNVGDYHPKQVTVLLDRKGERIAEIFSERRSYVAYDEVPPLQVDAFVVAEDAGFWTHGGIDYRGMMRAFFTNLRSGKTKQGASTITQQVVKTFVLSPERTFKRKIQEIILARRLEKKLSKKDILTLYMNQIYFGHGRYGVQEAARYYFGKDIKDVTIGEAALLAGLPQSPENISPRKNPGRAKERQTYVLNQLVKHGKITPAEAKKWIDAPIQVVREPFPHLGDAPEWLEGVKQELTAKFGDDGLDTLGASVRTTMRPDIQVAARAALRSALRAVDARHKLGRPHRKVPEDKIALETTKLARKLGRAPRAGATYEAVVTQVHDSDKELVVDLGGWTAALVLGLADDERWNPAGTDGARKKPSERFAKGDVIRVSLPPPLADGEAARKAKHGDNIVVLAAGPEGAVIVMDPHTREVWAMVGGFNSRAGGFNRATMARRQPGSAFKPIVFATALGTGRFTPATGVNDAPEVYDLWKPQNYKKGAFEGPVRLRYALAKSINTVAIKVLHDIGPDNAVEMAKQLGITGDLPRTLSLALGSGEVTPLEMTNAFATFAAGGVWRAPRFVARINNEDQAAGAEKQVLPPEIAYVITDMMRSVVEQGTATKAKSLKLTIAGKTGTSNDVKDTWFVGMTPDVVIGVWVGFDDNRPLGSGEAGGVTALPAFIDTMKAVGAKNRPFPKPAKVGSARIDLATGLIAADGADEKSTMMEVFVAGTEPTEVAPMQGETTTDNFVTDEYGDEALPPEEGGGGDEGAGPETVPR
ncbi:MAG TPA: PBP1A family penicillin-binding protein [Kofleriaceae bacterium]|nr:PBP1A family penicillin-binding protein [Kofleriaceae bacterium]